MENSKIEWTHHTFNPWIGCTKVSDGCKFCYAEELMAKRFKKVEWGPAGTRTRTQANYWRKPVAWNKRLEGTGKRERVFCASLADVFEDRPEINEWRKDLIELIEATPNLDWLLLTKRPENILPLAPVHWSQRGIPRNVWLGTSVEDQATADLRIPILTQHNATVLFLSCEPLLAPVDISHGFGGPAGEAHRGIDWVIVGGESDKHGRARPMPPSAALSLRDQCAEAGVDFFFKQWGDWYPYDGPDISPINLDYHKAGLQPKVSLNKKGESVPDDSSAYGSYKMIMIGKGEAGRLLNGELRDAIPEGIHAP